MPDLSHPDFCTMVEHVFKYVDKSSIISNMVEKLCQRLMEASPAQAENLAFCLSQLTYDEKAMRRLLDFTSVWQRHVFAMKSAHGYFRVISEKSKKSLKLLSEELDANLLEQDELRRRRKP
jgi:hypothetical protein